MEFNVCGIVAEVFLSGLRVEVILIYVTKLKYSTLWSCVIKFLSIAKELN